MKAYYKYTNLSMFDIHVISCRALRVDLTCRCLALCALFDDRHRMPHLSSDWRKHRQKLDGFQRVYLNKKKEVCLFLVGGGRAG